MVERRIFGDDAEPHTTTAVYHIKVKQCKVTGMCKSTASQLYRSGELENRGAQYYKLLITLLGQRWS